MQLKATLQGVTQQSHGKEAEEKVTSILYAYYVYDVSYTMYDVLSMLMAFCQ